MLYPVSEVKKATTIKQVGEFLGKAGESTIGFVPTMGALHSGHLSLVEKARAENDVVVVSIFVNPTQFNDPKDLETYPRMEDEDVRLLEKAGADIVFIPSVKEIYPAPDDRVFDFGPVAEVMEGASRPGHFNGVGQVVSRLFDIVKPDRAYFGEKDFQQVAVIRKMVEMLGSDVEIVVCPTVREKDGLALSSRNLLLTPQHRAAAPKIYAALKETQAKKGEMSVEEVEKFVIDKINADPLLRVEYFKIVDAATLQDVPDWDGERRGCVVVRAGKVRLIDNIGL